MVATNLEKKQQYFNLFSMTGNFGKDGGKLQISGKFEVHCLFDFIKLPYLNFQGLRIL